MSSMRFSIEQLNPAMRAQAQRKLEEWKRRPVNVVPIDRVKALASVPRISKPEARLALQLDALHIAYQREFRFHPVRKWRFDFCFPEIMLGVEVQGLTKEGGRHQRFDGFEGDCRKVIEATLLGWRVFPVTPRMVKRGEAIRYIEKVLANGYGPKNENDVPPPARARAADEAGCGICSEDARGTGA